MIDFGSKAKMVTPDMSCKSPRSLSDKSRRNLPRLVLPDDPLETTSPSSTLAYEQYLRLPELSKLWRSTDFPGWRTEALLKPALHGLEITFRFISLVLSDPRPYANTSEWTRRLESLALRQVELIAAVCGEQSDEAGAGAAPVIDLSESNGVLARDRSSSEVWKIAGAAEPVVIQTSEASLLPRLAAWRKSENVASKIAFGIECHMHSSPFTLGLGEPNLSGKPSLDYDLLCKPADVHALKRSPLDPKNPENQALFTVHQILECWIFAARELLRKIEDGIQKEEYEKCAQYCWLLERFWKLLSEIVDMHLLMDPADFLRLKNQLAIKASESESEAFCLRSAGLVDLTKSCKELRHRVPGVLGVEADPTGGPRVQEAAMRLFQKRSEAARVHLLQGFQAVEAALKRFFFGYREMAAVVMGSLEAKGNRAVDRVELSDQLSQLFSEPSYFPSLDAAKTFLGNLGRH